MSVYSGLDGRNKLVHELIDAYTSQDAPDVTFIQAGCGQGKSYITEQVVKNIENVEKIKVYYNQDDEIVPASHSSFLRTHNLNSLSISGGVNAFSFGIGLGWEKDYSSYAKIRNILSLKLQNNILICINNISDVSDELRFLITCIIKNIHMLKKEFGKNIFLLITDTQDIFKDVIYKNTNSYNIIELPPYSINDTNRYIIDRGIVQNISEENLSHIYELSQGNLDIVDFLYQEFIIEENKNLPTLQDVVAKRMAIIKSHGEKCDIEEKKIENIVFSASLALKKFTALFLKDISQENISDVEIGLDIAQKDSLMEKDFKKYYGFISANIQRYIAQITIEKHESLLISYYNYYTQSEQDEYFFRAYYIYKYLGRISTLSFSLFMLSYSVARKIEDEFTIRKIDDILSNRSVDESYLSLYDTIKNYYDVLHTDISLEKITQNYRIIKKYEWELPVIAELTCEYFHYIYRHTKLETPMCRNVLNDCINYAMNELTIDTSDVDMIKPIDETILRLKIIYEIAPCVLDHLNDYDKFMGLYNKSRELSNSNNFRQNGIGKYIENVFNRKAFLFANQAACSIYYQKARKYFSSNEIWVEYYITLICQAGTDIVIQEFGEAIQLCNSAEEGAHSKDINLPQIEKLHNNRIIAEFLQGEQNYKSPGKAITYARSALRKLKKLLTNEACATQFVIYTNICSLSLYIENDKQYIKYKNKLERLYKCKDISDVQDETIDDFYRYYFAWFELYRKINSNQWEKAKRSIDQLDNFIPALFRKQEIFWSEKNNAVKYLINQKVSLSAYDFCNNLVKPKRNEQVLSKFFYRGLMLSDLQYTSYF